MVFGVFFVCKNRQISFECKIIGCFFKKQNERINSRHDFGLNFERNSIPLQKISNCSKLNDILF